MTLYLAGRDRLDPTSPLPDRRCAFDRFETAVEYLRSLIGVGEGIHLTDLRPLYDQLPTRAPRRGRPWELRTPRHRYWLTTNTAPRSAR